jgi:hypothetical protein
MDADKLTRRTGYVSVFAVSAVSALLSYWHAVTVVGQHGEPGVYGHLYPATIDGLIVAASMVLLDSARHHVKAPKLAWVLLVLGIAATLTANVLDGVSGGFWGSIIAAWPAFAFIGAYEMIMVLVRAAASREKDEQPEIRLTPAEMNQLDRELDAEPKPMPKLEALLAETPPWEARHPEHVNADAPVLTDPTPTGRMAKLDAKTQSDEKAALRQTGTFGVVSY